MGFQGPEVVLREPAGTAWKVTQKTVGLAVSRNVELLRCEEN